MKLMRGISVVVLLATVFSFFADAEEGKDPRAFLTDFLPGLTLGKGIAVDHIVLFPILAETVPAPIAVVPGRPSATVAFEEIEFPDQPYDVAVRNAGPDPVLLIGGDVLVGGRLDRLVMRDFLVAPRSRVEFHALPAEYPRDRRAEPTPFKGGAALAPEYLRERAAFDPARTLVPIFLSYLLDFRNAGDNRRSLQALAESTELNEVCEACRKSIAEFPAVGEGKVVGFISAIRGRLHDLEMFGTNDLLEAWFTPILRAQIYAASGIEARAQSAGTPLRGSLHDDEASIQAVRMEAEKLLASLKGLTCRAAHMPPQAAGQTYLLKVGSARGIAIGDGGRLLHLALYPETPFEEELFSRPAKPSPDTDPTALVETSFGELERREARGGLSQAEERLLERMRERRAVDESPPLHR